MRSQAIVRFTASLTFLVILSGCSMQSSYKPDNQAFDNFDISQECVTQVQMFEDIRKISINLLDPKDLFNSLRDMRRYTYFMSDLTMKKPNCFPSDLSKTWAESAKDMQDINGDTDEEIQSMITEVAFEYYQVLNNQ